MKPAALIFILLISVELQAQTLADIARAERKRQQAMEAALKVEKQGEKPAALPEPQPPADVEKAVKESESEKEIPLEKKLQQERVDVMKKRSALLVRLDEVKHDPEAVKSIELQLIELSRQNEDLKLQHLKNAENAEK